MPGKFRDGAECNEGSIVFSQLTAFFKNTIPYFSLSEMLFYSSLWIIHTQRRTKKKKNQKKVLNFPFFSYSNDLSCWSAWIEYVVQFRSTSSLRANGVSRFLRNEQPSVKRALPPDGEQSTLLQPTQRTTVCAWLKTKKFRRRVLNVSFGVSRFYLL